MKITTRCPRTLGRLTQVRGLSKRKTSNGRNAWWPQTWLSLKRPSTNYAFAWAPLITVRGRLHGATNNAFISANDDWPKLLASPWNLEIRYIGWRWLIIHLASGFLMYEQSKCVSYKDHASQKILGEGFGIVVSFIRFDSFYNLLLRRCTWYKVPKI